MAPPYGLGPSPGPPKRMNWGMVAAVVAVLSLMLTVASGAFGDYRKVSDRVTVLETQRVEDVKTRDQQRADDSRWRERIETKIDRLLEQQRK